MDRCDVIIIGAGASGLTCAARTAERGRSTLVLDLGNKPARKVLMAGGGMGNFTNLDMGIEHFSSSNPDFCRSALNRHTPQDVISLMEHHRISWEERDHGRLFTTTGSGSIRDMLVGNARSAGAVIRMGVRVEAAERSDSGVFIVRGTGTGTGGSEVEYRSEVLVVASGGITWPSAGVSPVGYRIADSFGIPVIPVKPGLVPLVFTPEDRHRFSPLSGIAVDAEVFAGGRRYRENLLFTHRGISGPAVLQASSHWTAGTEITVNLLPGSSIADILETGRKKSPDAAVPALMSPRLPRRLVSALLPPDLLDRRVRSLNTRDEADIADRIQHWCLVPAGTAGARNAEVTFGGVDVNALSSKTFEARNVPGLHFIGEVLDVTGELGGYNLQWAWSSGWCAGEYA